MALLEIDQISKNFGGLCALNRISFQVEEGAIHGLIGQNGAGKTTLFNLITGVLRPSSGEILFKGRSIARLKPFEVAKLGISRTFQNVQLFGDMTVSENIMVGRHCRTKSELLGAIFRTRRVKSEERSIRERAMDILDFVGLSEKRKDCAKNLAYGQQRLLEIGRALATDPKLILLDEPAAGMNAQETSSLMSFIRGLRDKGHTILLIEHDMKMVMGISDIVSVLDFGEKIAEGKPEDVQGNQRVIEAYLGRDS